MPSKKELKKNIKKMTIMQSAEEIFEKKAYGDITMDEIANKSGLTKKTVYSYFPSKLALFINIIDGYLQRLHEGMLQVVECRLPINKSIKELFWTLFEFTREIERIMRLYWALESEEAGGIIPADMSNRSNIWNKAMIEEMTKLIDRAIGDKHLKNYDPETVLHMFSAFNKGVFIHTNKAKRFGIADIDAQQLFEFFSEIVFREIFRKVD